MREQVFKTRITELLGIRHPILCGGLGPGVSDARYVAAVVNAGGMGFIVAAGFDAPDQIRDEVRLCRELTGGKPFGVNLYISRQPGGLERVKALLPFLIDHGVACVETAGANPEPIVPILREAGVKVIHKVPAVKYAKTAARIGADAIIIVGSECGGHPGVFQIGTMVQAAHGPMTVDLPVVIGGGIGTGRQMAATLAMGAEGIIMGTRMLVCEELWISEAYKRFVVGADGTESRVVKRILRDHHRVLDNDSAKAIEALEEQKVTDFEQYRPHVVGPLARHAYKTGDWSRGMLDFGHAAIFADAVKPVEAIIDEMIDDAVAAMGRLGALMPPRAAAE